MKNLTTLFAVLTLTLMSCKKEAPIVNRVSYEATVEANSDYLHNTIQKMYKNEVLILDPVNTRYNNGDRIRITFKNDDTVEQTMAIKLSANNLLIKGDEQLIPAGSTMELNHTF